MRRCGAVVAGTGLPNADGSLRSQLIRRHCKNGVSVYLRREPNSHDSANAVAVYLEAPRVLGLFGSVLRQIGYIKTSRVKDIARRMDAGEEIRARISRLHVPKGPGCPQVNIDLEYL